MSDEHNANDAQGSPPTPVRLRWRRHELLLTTGTYLVGRDSSCHILLEEPRVSRRHARIAVDGNLVFIEDLGSMNGLLVNGVRVVQRRALFDGDWITIAGEELEVCIGDSARARHRTETVDELTSVPPSSQQDADRKISEPPADSEPTQRSRSLEILGSIADRALETGKLEDAEDMLKTTLLDILQEASAGHVVDAEARDFCVRYALRLAERIGHPRWLEYSIDLLRALRHPCSEELASSLRVALRRVGPVDAERLQTWSDLLKAQDSTRAKSARRVDELIREVHAQRR